jgi:peptide-methionine (S)-S-oxide reductase
MSETITLGGGCFWCTEAIFNRLKGVEDVQSGFSGGTTPNPTYEGVAYGQTDHAEVVEITFDPAVISLHDLLTIFFTLHDPTTVNRQGNDTGPQYRSLILYRTPEQQKMAETVIQEIEAQGIWEDPIVTEVEPFTAFYPADESHDRYFERNQNSYCQFIIEPKVVKLRKLFQDKLS